MGLYFGETEMQGLHFGDMEITGLYFGETEIWAALAEYDGILPAQYNANGSTLADYRIYGAAGGVGDDSGTAYGYVVPMSVQMGELRQDVVQGGWNGQNGGPVTPYSTGEFAPIRCRIGPFYVDNAKRYTISVVPRSLLVTIKEAGTNGIQVNDTGWGNAHVITPKANATWFAITIRKSDNSNITPADVQCVKIITSEATTTPIYIGSEPLEADEYVDYGSGKIYRMSGGVLTPTDPPVPLPALPTVDGVTITDYAGQSVAVPSRFYAKYRKGGHST